MTGDAAAKAAAELGAASAACDVTSEADGQHLKGSWLCTRAPDEVASAVLFLASDLASYVTGAVLEVGGGRRM